MIEQGTASLSMADVDQRGVGKMNAKLTTATDMAADASNQPKRKYGIVENTTYGLCITLGLASLISMIATNSLIVYVAMSLGVFSSANVVRQRLMLAMGSSLREVINKIRNDVNRLSKINDSLTNNVEEIGIEVARLGDIEKSLQGLLAEGQQDMNEFMNLLKINKEVQGRQVLCIKKKVSENIIEQVIRSDRNGDFVINPDEIEMLLTRLETIEGLEINEERFKKKIKLRGSGLHSVIAVIRNLMESKDDDEAIFRIDVVKYALKLVLDLNKGKDAVSRNLDMDYNIDPLSQR